MSDEVSNADDDSLGEVLAEYLTRLDRGESVNREDLLAAHPQCAAELRTYFADAALIARLAGNGAHDSARELASLACSPGDFGDYELLEEIGRGGMGIVYKVRERTTGRSLALKMLLAGLFAAPRDIERFRNEARAAANLKHPAIVPIYHVGEHQGHLFYTMPWIEGTNLARRLAESPFEPRAAAELMATVAEAVDYAHTCGVIHRDLKPANILLDEASQPYVADFGLARRLGEDLVGLTATGDMIGTPNYMAPEQVKGSSAAISAAADIYALGAVLYALLVGRPPFQSASIPDTLHKICSAEPVRPRQARRAIPRDLETICLKCLEKPAARRYVSARVLAEDLRRFLAGEPITARPVGRFERGRRWFARNPVVGSLIVGIAASLVVGTCGSTYYAVQAQARALEAQESALEASESAFEAREGERQALRNLYAADMSLAQQYANGGWISSSLNVLERHRPPPGDADRRGWEWHYGWRQCQGELRQFVGHEGAVNSATFSSDGRLLAAGCADKNVYLWETATGVLLHTMQGHEGPVRGIAFNPAGGRIVSVSDDRQALVWDTATGKRIAVLEIGERPLTSVAWSRNGSLVAAAGSDDPTVRLWDAREFKLLRTLDLGPAEQLTFSADSGSLALAGRDGLVRVCRTDDGHVVATLGGHRDVVHGLAMSPDGARLATASSDLTVRIWDTHSWTETARYSDFRDAVWRVAFSSDGRRLAIGGRSEPVRVRDIGHPEVMTELRGHTALVTAVAFCPTDDRLVTASEDGTLRLWDSGRSTEYDTLSGHLGSVFTVAFSPDSRLLASAGWDSSVIVWDAPTARPLRVMRSNAGLVWDLAFSPDGSQLAAAEEGGQMRVWDVATGREAIGVPLGMGPLRGVAFSPDGMVLAVGSAARAIQLLDAVDGHELAALAGHIGGLGGLAFNAQGTLLASCGADKIVRIWRVATREVVQELKGHTAPVLHVAFSRDGRLLASSSNDHSIRIWDVATGRMVRVITGHGGTVYSVVFSPDGRRVISGSVDRTVKIWDLESGHELQTLEGNTDWVRDVTVSPDGQLIASAGSDHRVRIWDARAPSKELAVEREAAAIVAPLAARFRTSEPTLSAIRSMSTISEPVRAAALRQAKQHLYYWDDLLRGHAAADCGDRPTAADAFEQVVQLAPNDVMHWYWLAISSLAANRRDEYERACQEMLREFGSDSSQLESLDCLRACLVVPRPASDLLVLRPVLAVYDKQCGGPDTLIHWLFEHRLGETPAAFRPPYSSPLFIGPEPYDAHVPAMIYLKQGDVATARAAFDAALRASRTGFGSTPWWNERWRAFLCTEFQGSLEAAGK